MQKLLSTRLVGDFRDLLLSEVILILPRILLLECKLPERRGPPGPPRHPPALARRLTRTKRSAEVME